MELKKYYLSSTLLADSCGWNTQYNQFKQKFMKNTSPKRILLMGHIDGIGGAQTAYHELCDFALHEAHIIKVITITDKERNKIPFSNDIFLGKIDHKRRTGVPVLNKLYELISVSVLSWKFKPDIFVSVGLSNSANFVARFLGKQCFKIGQDFITRKQKKDLLWNNSRIHLDAIAVQAPYMLEVATKTGVDLTGVNWLPCFPIPPVKGIIRSEYIVGKNSVKLGYFGRLASNKGLTLLIEALSVVNVSNNISLDLWGEGTEMLQLQELTGTLGLQSQVRFLGKYPADKAGALLMISYDALVLCSTDSEGLPLVLLESMAYGLPFLATDVGAIRDCCVGNPDSILVEPSKDDIIKGLLILIKRVKTGDFDPKRLQNFYRKTFSRSVMIEQWQTCFNNPHEYFYASK